MNSLRSGKGWQTKRSINAKMIVNVKRIMYNKCKIKKEKVKIRKITEAKRRTEKILINVEEKKGRVKKKKEKEYIFHSNY